MTKEEYRAFMCDPENEMNCLECPNNIGVRGDKPCGQQNCWVYIHTAVHDNK